MEGDMEIADYGKKLAEQIPRLRRYARALTRDAGRADDLVQDCLLRAIRKRHLFQPDTDLRAWLFTLMHNQYVNDIRRLVREGVHMPIEEFAPTLAEPSGQSAGLQLRELDDALSRLPVEQRQAVLLVGLEGFAYEDAAAILSVPVGTVRSRLSRARDSLRLTLERQAPRAAA
jgi:RNA polymerase sigma-70 factor, ECF subfamily